MNSAITHLNLWAEPFWQLASAMFVQSSLLILLLLAVDFLLRHRVRAVVRYALWMLVLVKLVLPPSLASPVSVGRWLGGAWPAETVTPMPDARLIPQQRDSPSSLQVGFLEGEALPSRFSAETQGTTVSVPNASLQPSAYSLQPARLPPITGRAYLFLAWFAGILALLVVLVHRGHLCLRLLRRATAANGELAGLLDECCSAVSLGHGRVRVRLVDEPISPAVCGLFRPIILLPGYLLDRLNREQLRSVLLHELAHVKRYDLFVNAAQTVLQILYFYNPLLWLANSVIRRIREQAVDEMVLVSLGKDAPDYSRTLVDVAELAFRRPLLTLRLIGVVESKKALAQRIKHIVSRPLPKTATVGVMSLLAIALAAAVLLPMAKGERPESSASPATPAQPPATNAPPVGTAGNAAAKTEDIKNDVKLPKVLVEATISEIVTTPDGKEQERILSNPQMMVMLGQEAKASIGKVESPAGTGLPEESSGTTLTVRPYRAGTNLFVKGSLVITPRAKTSPQTNGVVESVLVERTQIHYSAVITDPDRPCVIAPGADASGTAMKLQIHARIVGDDKPIRAVKPWISVNPEAQTIRIRVSRDSSGSPAFTLNGKRVSLGELDAVLAKLAAIDRRQTVLVTLDSASAGDNELVEAIGLVNKHGLTLAWQTVDLRPEDPDQQFGVKTESNVADRIEATLAIGQGGVTARVVCPSGGSDMLGVVGQDPQCSVHGTLNQFMIAATNVPPVATASNVVAKLSLPRENAVMTRLWNASKAVHSCHWFTDGKYTSGSQFAPGSERISLTVTRHRDSIGYVLQYATDAPSDGIRPYATGCSDTIRWDPTNTPEMTSPFCGTLRINGPTSVFKFEERTRDGHVVKTVELFLSSTNAPPVGAADNAALTNLIDLLPPEQRVCINNLRQLDSATEQAALADNLPDGAAVPRDKLTRYIKGGLGAMVCPSGGSYTPGVVGADPRCSFHGMLRQAKTNVRVVFVPEATPTGRSSWTSKAQRIVDQDIPEGGVWHYDAQAGVGGSFPVYDGNGTNLFNITVLRGDDSSLTLKVDSPYQSVTQQVPRDGSFTFEHKGTAFQINYPSRWTAPENARMSVRAGISVFWQDIFRTGTIPLQGATPIDWANDYMRMPDGRIWQVRATWTTNGTIQFRNATVSGAEFRALLQKEGISTNTAIRISCEPGAKVPGEEWQAFQDAGFHSTVFVTPDPKHWLKDKQPTTTTSPVAPAGNSSPETDVVADRKEAALAIRQGGGTARADRVNSRTREMHQCIVNMRQLTDAKRLAAQDDKLANGAEVPTNKLTLYVSGGLGAVVCPSGGSYTPGVVGQDPQCSVHGTLNQCVSIANNYAINKYRRVTTPSNSSPKTGVVTDRKEPQEQKTTEAAPVITKYDGMEKKQLQEALKTLTTEILVAEQTSKEATTKVMEAGKAYESAPNDQKPELLLRYVEAQAQIPPKEYLRQLRNELEAAKQAYLKLLLAEQK